MRCTHLPFQYNQYYLLCQLTCMRSLLFGFVNPAISNLLFVIEKPEQPLQTVVLLLLTKGEQKEMVFTLYHSLSIAFV